MINVIGLGYIGLPTALMMASHGVEVIGCRSKGWDQVYYGISGDGYLHRFRSDSL